MKFASFPNMSYHQNFRAIYSALTSLSHDCGPADLLVNWGGFKKWSFTMNFMKIGQLVSSRMKIT